MASGYGLACKLCGGLRGSAGCAQSALLSWPALRRRQYWLGWPKLCPGYRCAVFRSVFCCIGRS